MHLYEMPKAARTALVNQELPEFEPTPCAPGPAPRIGRLPHGAHAQAAHNQARLQRNNLQIPDMSCDISCCRGPKPPRTAATVGEISRKNVCSPPLTPRESAKMLRFCIAPGNP